MWDINLNFSWTGTLFLACCLVRASIVLVPELLATVTLKFHSVSTHIRAMMGFSAIPAAEFRGWPVLDYGGVRGCIPWHMKGVEGWVRRELRHWRGRSWESWPGPRGYVGGVGIAKPNGRVPGCGIFRIISGEEAVPYYEMGGAGNTPWGASLLENVAVVGADRAVRVGLVPLIHVCVQSQRLGMGLVHCCLEPEGVGWGSEGVRLCPSRSSLLLSRARGGWGSDGDCRWGVSNRASTACWSFSTVLESSSIRLFRHLQRMQIFSSGLQKRSHSWQWLSVSLSTLWSAGLMM